MILEQGQYINNGEKDLLVCATMQYKKEWYVYLLDEETDDVAFYKIDITDIGYDFTKVMDEKLIEILILEFAKDFKDLK